MYLQKRKTFLGERVRRVWKELHNEKENYIYADLEYSRLLGIEESFSIFANLELDTKLTTKQDGVVGDNIFVLKMRIRS